MKIKQHLYIRLLLFLSIALIPTLLPVQAQSIFRIGVIDTEDGAITRGAQLAVRLINQAGGITGSEGTVYNLEVVVASPDDLNIAVANMNQAGIIAVLGPETTEQMLSGISTLQQLNVPVFTPAIGDTILLQDNTNRLFRSRAQEVVQARALANYLVDELNIRSITTVQLDVASTASIIGLTTGLSTYNITPFNILYDETTSNIEMVVSSVLQNSPDTVGIYGPPDLAVQVYNRLKSSDYAGYIMYNQATHPDFINFVPSNQLFGILNVTTWSPSADDEISEQFLVDYVQTFGMIPNAIAAASYDAVQLIAAGTSQPGELAQNIASLNDFPAVQGVLNPARLSRGEVSTNVSITQLNEFGTPRVIARYIGNQIIPVDDPEIVVNTPTPIPSPTPDGFTATIQSQVQNIRSGPSTDYPVLGQLPEGSQVRVIGATADFTWLVIDYRGQQGWLATYLVDTFGDRNRVPIIQPPPTPTAPPPTATPSPAPYADIIILSATPGVLTLDQQFTSTITVLNQGLLPAGPFAVAGTFQPGGAYVGVNIGGLGAGQQTQVQLQQTITGSTGKQSIQIIADLNNQVDEGPQGEANNSIFTYSYMADHKTINSGTLTLAVEGTLNLEGSGSNDVKWVSGTDLEVRPSPPPAGVGMYIITGYASINDVHFDVINPALATSTSLNVSLLPNAIIGIVTSDGNRGVMQVTSVTSGGPITITYRVYDT